MGKQGNFIAKERLGFIYRLSTLFNPHLVFSAFLVNNRGSEINLMSHLPPELKIYAWLFLLFT